MAVKASSDLHLGHKAICKYRTAFKTVGEHDHYIIKCHIQTIGKNDIWICLGDVAFDKEALQLIKQIKCKKKILILGNHDLERGGITMKDLLEVFDEVLGFTSRKFNGVKYWLSHAPIHPDEMRGKAVNIHGHMHETVLKDKRYINVCCEHTAYGAVDVEKLLKPYMVK